MKTKKMRHFTADVYDPGCDGFPGYGKTSGSGVLKVGFVMIL